MSSGSFDWNTVSPVSHSACRTFQHCFKTLKENESEGFPPPAPSFLTLACPAAASSNTTGADKGRKGLKIKTPTPEWSFGLLGWKQLQTQKCSVNRREARKTIVPKAKTQSATINNQPHAEQECRWGESAQFELLHVVCIHWCKPLWKGFK